MKAAAAQKPTGPTRAWGKILCPDPPPMRHHIDDMLAMARSMLTSRENAFPAEIEAGLLSIEDAEFRLLTFRRLIADLEWVQATRRGEDCGPNTLTALQRGAICEQLDNAIDRLSAMANGMLSTKQSDQAHDLIAIRWNYDGARLGSLGLLLIHENALLNQMWQRPIPTETMFERKAA